MATIIPERRPTWLRVRLPKGENYEQLKQLMRSQELHTVCEYEIVSHISEYVADNHDKGVIPMSCP